MTPPPVKVWCGADGFWRVRSDGFLGACIWASAGGAMAALWLSDAQRGTRPVLIYTAARR